MKKIIHGGVDLSGLRLTKLPDLSDVEIQQGHFFCSGNHLVDLRGSPIFVGKDFYCDFNRLTSLEGAPAEVRGHFNCRDNPLKSLKGIPKSIGLNFVFSDPNDLFTDEMIRAESSIGGRIIRIEDTWDRF